LKERRDYFLRNFLSVNIFQIYCLWLWCACEKDFLSNRRNFFVLHDPWLVNILAMSFVACKTIFDWSIFGHVICCVLHRLWLVDIWAMSQSKVGSWCWFFSLQKIPIYTFNSCSFYISEHAITTFTTYRNFCISIRLLLLVHSCFLDFNID